MAPILCHYGKQEVSTVAALHSHIDHHYVHNDHDHHNSDDQRLPLQYQPIIIVTNSSWIGIILIAFMMMTVIRVVSDCARAEVTVQ